MMYIILYSVFCPFGTKKNTNKINIYKKSARVHISSCLNVSNSQLQNYSFEHILIVLGWYINYVV